MYGYVVVPEAHQVRGPGLERCASCDFDSFGRVRAPNLGAELAGFSPARRARRRLCANPRAVLITAMSYFAVKSGRSRAPSSRSTWRVRVTLAHCHSDRFFPICLSFFPPKHFSSFTASLKYSDSRLSLRFMSQTRSVYSRRPFTIPSPPPLGHLVRDGSSPCHR